MLERNDLLAEVLLDESRLRLIDEDIYSVLPTGTGGQAYDRRAAGYDWLLSRQAYNRFVWGASPDDYREFGRRSVESVYSGVHLDAGCGTLLFTAESYIRSGRPIVALDLSLGMLAQARKRVIELSGSVPENMIFLQGDLLDLPFRQGSFASVLSMGMLHLFDDAYSIVENLNGSLEEDGELYLTSLVAHNRAGDRYLRLLHRAGEVATVRTAAELQGLLRAGSTRTLSYRVTGNMAYAVLAQSTEAVGRRALWV